MADLKLTQNVRDILEKNMKITPEQQILLIYDDQSKLSQMLKEAYVQAGQELKCNTIALSFYEAAPEEVIKTVKSMKVGDIVVLVESSSFRMSNFRWRLELFNLGLGVVEHAHLGVNKDEEAQNYIDVLAYQGDFYQKASKFLKPKINQAKKIVVECHGTTLMYETPMEDAKLNIGDYSDKKNKGSGYPIGEIFSEPKNLEGVNGEIMIYAFANKEHRVIFTDPFKTIIEKGCMTAPDAPEEFKEILAMVQSENPDGRVVVREFGLGFNAGISKTKRLTDISAYERVKGMHMSLGMKHDIYRSKVEKGKVQRFHIDIFPDIQRISIDGTVIFENGEYKF
jgi:aminopeptidase